MTENEALSRLPLVNRLELLEFDARLTGTPEPLAHRARSSDGATAF
jgi:hypothetical protein